MFVTKLSKYVAVVIVFFSLVSLVLLKVARYELSAWTLPIFLTDWVLLFAASIVVPIAAVLGMPFLSRWMEKEKPEASTIAHGIMFLPIACVIFPLGIVPFMIWEEAREAIWQWETMGIVNWYMKYPETPGDLIDKVVYPLIMYGFLIAIPWFFAKFDGQIKKLIINFG